jgi:two-component system OmpR family response regulator
VLVVEDDPVLGAVLHDVLEAAGHRVEVATSAADAVAAAEEILPDAVCVDIDLPDGTGWELLDELERRMIVPPTVVVATAGFDASQSRHRPGTHLLPKPFPVDSLLRLLSGEEPPEI